MLLGDSARINQPILEGLTLLARPRFPMHFFSSLPAAAGWLCDTVARCAEGPLAANDLVAAAESVRRLQPERRDRTPPRPIVPRRARLTAHARRGYWL